jgi:hypothetical protein
MQTGRYIFSGGGGARRKKAAKEPCIILDRKTVLLS